MKAKPDSIDLLGLLEIDIIAEVQNFFGSIVAWVLGLLGDVTGLDWFDLP